MRLERAVRTGHVVASDGAEARVHRRVATAQIVHLHGVEQAIVRGARDQRIVVALRVEAETAAEAETSAGRLHQTAHVQRDGVAAVAAAGCSVRCCGRESSNGAHVSLGSSAATVAHSWMMAALRQRCCSRRWPQSSPVLVFVSVQRCRL